MFYQLVEFELNQKYTYCIWYSNDSIGLITRDKKIIFFHSVDDARYFANQKNISLDVDIAIYDFDQLLRWINSDTFEVDCDMILNFWNIFTDFSSSSGCYFDGDKKTKSLNNIYDKLFSGSNVLNDAEKQYPKWSKQEVDEIKTVLLNGINMLLREIK